VGMRDFDHTIITRFNVEADPSRGIVMPERGPPDAFRIKRDVHLDDGWLESRLDLFARFCAPSVAAQSSREFTWIVAVDAKTPGSFVARLSKAAPLAVIVRTGPDWRPAVIESLHGKRARAVTTRLDSDDAIHRDFVARVGNTVEAEGGVDYVVACRAHYVLEASTMVLKQAWVASPACLCFVERAGNLTSVYKLGHVRLVERSRVVPLDFASWLRVVHSDNAFQKRVSGCIVEGNSFEILHAKFNIIDPSVGISRGGSDRPRSV